MKELEPTLKPCPNCGSINILTRYDKFDLAYMKCVCGASGPVAQEISEAIQAWNNLPRRDEPQPIDTAPKDGTWILVWRDLYPTWIPLRWEGKAWQDLESCYDTETSATHWLPMPPFPEVTE